MTEDAITLTEQLRRASTAVCHGEAPSSTDAELRDYLLGLYGNESMHLVWEDHVAPFVAAHAADIAALYCRHRRLPNPVLDQVEGVMVLERLERTPRQLAERWPRPAIELERLAQNWAVAL